MASKSEDTQALSSSDIKEAGVNYRPRTRTQPQQQSNSVQIAGFICLTVVLLGALTAFVLVILTVMGRL